MLSKHKFLPTKSLFLAAGIAACGLAAVQQSANALSLNFQGQFGNDFLYSLEIQPGEVVSTGDTVQLLQMTGATGGTATNSLGTFFTSPGALVGDSEVTFTTFQSNIAAGVFDGNIGTFTITSTDPLGTIRYSLNGGPEMAIQGPTSVPFEFSPGLGLILSGTLIGALQLRSKFGKKEEINF